MRILRCLAVAFGLAVLLAGAARAADDLDLMLDRLWLAWRMDEALVATQQAALGDVARMDQELLGGRGGLRFRAAVERLYAPEPVARAIRTSLRRAFDGRKVALSAYLEFLDSPAGNRNLRLLDQANLTLGDAAARRRAVELFATRMDQGDPRYLLVVGAASYWDRQARALQARTDEVTAYYQGFRDGGGFAASDDAIAALVADMEPGIFAAVDDERQAIVALWVEEMTLAEVKAVESFFASPLGHEAGLALETSRQAMDRKLHYDLGLLAGRFVHGLDL